MSHHSSKLPNWPAARAVSRGTKLSRILAAALLGAGSLFAQATSTPALRINEVLAANTQIANAGTYPDIIELHNADAAAIELSGMSLTDDPLLPRKYEFPNGTNIPAGGYLVVYADSNSSAPGLHAGFSLDSEGDRVQLRDTRAAGGALRDEIVFGFQISNHSLSRTGAATDTWALTTPTPGAANGSAVALGSAGLLKLNEWAGKIAFRLDHDMIELFNPQAQPVALAGVRMTDDPARPDRFQFPALSFIAANGFLPLYGADFKFGLDGDIDPIYLSAANGAPIDNVILASQPRDYSTGRNPDGSATITNFATPTPGMSNQTVLPDGHAALLANLRITEVMYQPSAPANAGDYEFIELQNIGTATLVLSGVRFTNGIDYTFPSGTTLAGGAFTVVARNRTVFLSRYPAAAGVLAPNAFSGSLDNTGETIALTLPSPWYVHILRFRFEPDWYTTTRGGGHSLVIPAPAATQAIDWREPASWRASSAQNGSPGAADTGGAQSGSSRIINLSILTPIAAAGDDFTMGYVVGGSGASGAKPLVIRAAGPSLVAFGIDDRLADPKFELFAGQTPTGGNENWGGSADLANAMAAVGAFPYIAATSLDAATRASVTITAGRPSDNSVKVSANGNGTGRVLAEVYDATPEASVTATTPRLVNVSVLKEFGGGFTAGFVIRGTGTKTVLIRAVGPGLANVGITSGFVADPQVTLFRGPTQLRTNNDWQAGAAATFTQVGAFALPAGSRDAALVETLQPDDYTVQVSGVGGATGLGLVEVYEVP